MTKEGKACPWEPPRKPLSKPNRLITSICIIIFVIIIIGLVIYLFYMKKVPSNPNKTKQGNSGHNCMNSGQCKSGLSCVNGICV